MTVAPVSVGIPTFARGLRLTETLDQLSSCDPPPAEIIVHVDGSNGKLERELISHFPTLRLLSSRDNVGPGGGRHRCLKSATQPFFASFDDDSWPVDSDFFAEALALFSHHPRVAVVAGTIYHRHQMRPDRSLSEHVVADYTGCGHVMRVAAYQQTTGYIDRPFAYGIEEVDLAMQLHALDWTILQCGALRVFHDTQLAHHSNADAVASIVQNVALRAYLRYPPSLWPRALLQLFNSVLFMIKMRRFAGLAQGLLGIPGTLVHYSSRRRQLPAEKIRSYLNSRQRLSS